MAHPREPRAPVTKVTREARFVFTGTVEKQGASSLFFVPPGGATAVVRVERIHYAAPSLRNQEGQQVTVVFVEGSDPAKGQRVFFTNPILYGETVAVKEVQSSEAARDIAQQHEGTIQMINEAEKDNLKAHIASAEAVVQGKVVRIERASEPDPAKMSEHDPDWHVAIISVEKTLKGKHKDELAVRFPKSRDIAWYRVPKLEDGQVGVFVLHRDGLELGGASLALIHPEDLLPGGAETARKIAEVI